MESHDWHQLAAYAFGCVMIGSMGLMAVYFLGIGLFEAFKNINAKLNRESAE